jgi:hypothetical protein
MSTLKDRTSCRSGQNRDEDHLDRETGDQRDPEQTARLIELMDCRNGLGNEDRFCLLVALCHCYARMPLSRGSAQ